VLYEFTDYTYSVSVVHCFIEEITVKLNDVRVVLGFEQLYCFFLWLSVRDNKRTYLVLIELVEGLCFNFFEGVVLARSDVKYFIDLSVLLTRS
jgi:hypothetical protein